MRSVTLVLTATLVLSRAARTARAEESVTELRARLAERPGDPAVACRLAFALVLATTFDEAREVASPAIEALRPRGEPSSVRTLGACLYNRGRAYEGLGDGRRAAMDYAESLSLRPNEAVAARLGTLVPGAATREPVVTFAAAAAGLEIGEGDVVEVTSAATRDRTRWSFFCVREHDHGYERVRALAVARIDGALHVAELDEVYYDDAFLSVESATARRLGGLDAVVLELSGGGDENCGTMEGMADFDHRATVVVFAEGGEIRAAPFVTVRHDCGTASRAEMTVTLDAAGGATTRRVAGRRPSGAIGRVSLREAARRAEVEALPR